MTLTMPPAIDWPTHTPRSTVLIPTRVALYLRQSLDRHGDELAVSRQRQDGLALCAAKGWPVPIEYKDNDTSATKGVRKAYQRLLADIRAGRIDAVVVWDLDRLHRRPMELEEFIDLADAKGLKLATVTGDCDLSTDNGRLFARIKGAVAKAEMERKKARQQRAATQQAQNGNAWWCQRPFGYDADPGPDGKWKTSGQEIRLHPVEAPLVKAAYESVLGGTPLHRIAAKWNAAGITRPKGGPWRSGTVRTLLLSARNAGLREHHGEVVSAALWPAIVTEEQWRGVVTLLSNPPGTRVGPRGRTRLLTGIATCGECERTLGGGVTRASGTLTYVCKHCGKVSRAAEPIDAMAIRAVVERLSRDDAAELVVNRELPNIDELIEQRRLVREEQKALGAKLAKHEVSLAMATVADNGFTEEINALTARIDDAPRAEIFEGLIGVDDVDAAFDALDLGRQRTVVKALITVVVKATGRGRRYDRPVHADGRNDVDIDYI